jgi:nicotinate-nucleotide--dimethylbenzimidazole phosphoribosyltransferase
MPARSAIAEHDVKARLDALAKPPGSLGKLERLAARLAVTQGRLDPRTRPRRLIVFAGDHGVVADGVGLWPSAVTGAMMRLMRAGRSSASALGRVAGADFLLVDAGSCAEGTAPGPGFLDARAGRGTASFAHGPAMSIAEFDTGWTLGQRIADESAAAGFSVLALGEMGIGNTTTAAALGALLTGTDPDLMVGPGAGATGESLARKRAIVASGVARAREEADPRAAIAAVCGHEIAALAGCIAGAARHRVTVVLDGLIVGAAALVAARLSPDALATSIAAHVSAEPGHARMLEALGLEPFLDWGLRLGEGTGAALLLPMLDAAAALLTDVATIEEALGG